MKKIFALLLTLVLLVTPIVSFAAAPEAKSFLEGPAQVASDTEFEVTYSLQGDEIRAADGRIDFNSARVLVQSVDMDAAGWIIEYEEVDNGILFAVANETGKRAISEKTEVFTITFKATKAEGTAGMSASFQNVANGKAEMVSLADTKYTDPDAEKKDETTSSEETPSEDTNNNNNQSGNQGGVTIVPPVADGPSADFTLSSLKVKGYDIYQKGTQNKDFDPEVKNYELTVPFSVEKLEIEALTTDDGATVEITEADLVYVGTNITKIVVTAENGSKRTYKIYTTRLAPENDGNANAGANEGLGNWLYVIIGAGVLLLLLIIIIVIIILKKKKN